MPFVGMPGFSSTAGTGKNAMPRRTHLGGGNTYAVGLEPWTNRWRPNPQDSIEAGEWLRIAAGEVITTKLEASGFERTYG
ncbi:MAG: hypothetical protein IPN76_31755 [Saprospiraceae bacterium]|nr:hypothetical protein [Saprospiraceae bacterium]